jgi:chromosome segregation ATPase
VKERKEEIERQVFKRELSDLLLDQYRDRIEEQDKALKEKDFDVALSKESVAAAYSEISALSSQVLYWKQEVAINEGHIFSLAHKLEGNTGQMTRQNNQIAKLEKERREAMDGCRYFEAQIKRLKATYDELLLRVDALNAGCNVDKQTE